tara:strand:+ start:97 stop:330 length:234 start_codon:yes stop_codon:yes gene_type:complete
MIEIIKELVMKEIPESNINVEGDGSKYVVNIISDIFVNKSIVERHKIIYSILDKYIKSGEIHALTIFAKTISENDKS